MTDLPDIQSIETIFGDFKTDLLDHPNGREYYWSCPSHMGQGSMYMINLRPDLALAMGSCCFSSPLAYSYDNEESCVIFGFSLSGGLSTTIQHRLSPGSFRYLEQGCCVLSYLPRWKGVSCHQPNKPLTGVQILVRHDLFNSLLDHNYCRIPGDLNEMATNKCPYLKSMAMPPAVQIIVRQLLSCSLQGPMRTMYFEGKALELVSMGLSLFAPPKQKNKTPSPIRISDMDAVVRTRELICRRFKNPPALQELAKTVGLQHTRLNQCFREVYGTTIFNYVKELRLTHAKNLLDQGRINVTDAAFEVGYASPSHFSKVFKSQFGTDPSTYLRQSNCRR